MRIRTPDQRVRVFVSSTLGELAEERKAARAAVEQLRLTPVMFELGARPHPPRALYRSYLAQSDVFVGIYWQRYGWVAPDMEISGLDDELLLSVGMPRLIYVKRPAPEMDPRLREMLARFEGDDGPSYKPFGDAAELRDLLLDDLSLLLAERFDRAEPGTAVERRPSNLAAPTSTFVGRRAELDRLRVLFDDDTVRLVTLTGPGGTGKTRLAVEAARAAVPRFEDGVFFVDLAAERQPDEAFAAIARVLDVGPGGASPLERVAHDLAARHVLLVVDNVEQVTAIGPALVALLERCPRLSIVVTSREVLRVSAEHVFTVPVMSLPADDGATPSMADVLDSEAGRLFVERAAAVGHGVALTDEDAADVVAICRRLDGLPLALELAAARVKLLSVGELRARLDRRLDVLTGGDRDRPDRQRTLRDAIEWSHELLSDDERTVFRLLSVFADGRLVDIDETLRALPVVQGLDVVEMVSSLVDKSLVVVVPGSDRRPRCSMLQTIREYAAEQLAGSPELEAAVRAAHAAHYTAVALDLHRQLTYADRAAVLASLGDELGNLRATWEHWVDHHDVVRLDDLLAPLWGYHEAGGDYQAAVVLGEELLRTLADLPETRERRHDELTVRANLARTQLVVRGFSPEAERAIVEALDRFETSGEAARQRFPALRSLAALQLWRSDFDRAARTSTELMAIAEEEQDPALLMEAHLTTCISTSWVADVPAAIVDADRAAAYFDAATSGFVEFRVGPNPGVVANAIAGLLRWTAGLPDAALANMDRALALADQLRHPYSRAFALHHATVLDVWRSDMASVAARADESRRLADAHDYAIWRALAIVFRGVAAVAHGDADRGVAEMEAGFTLYQELTNPPIFWPALLGIRATIHGWAGDVDHGLELIERARTSLGLGDGHPAAAEIAIAHGDLLLAAPAPDASGAGALFERAAALSAERGARMIELQALTRLATVRDERETLERLRAVYATFTEGFTTPQLRAAAALL